MECSCWSLVCYTTCILKLNKHLYSRIYFYIYMYLPECPQIDLYEFLTESELQQYYNAIK